MPHDAGKIAGAKAPIEAPDAWACLTEDRVVGRDSEVADDMKNFSEQLKPLVNLDKVDPRRAGL